MRGATRARAVVDGSISASTRASERGARGFDGDVGVATSASVFISHRACITMVLRFNDSSRAIARRRFVRSRRAPLAEHPSPPRRVAVDCDARDAMRRRASTRARAMLFALFALTCATLPRASDAREACATNVTAFKRLADLRAFRNPALRGAFCVTRLRADGVAGCSNDAITSAPLLRLRPDGNETIELDGERVLVATPAAWQNLMRQAFVANDARSEALRGRIKAVLVEAIAPESEEEREWARGYAPGPAHETNVTGGFVGGVDAMGMDLRGVPMMLLDRESTLLARKRSLDNVIAADAGREKDMWQVRTDERMNGLGKQPTLAPPTSFTCLKSGSCLPIGGYSVVATAPPMWGRTGGPHAGKSVILVIARLDANGLFRDATPAVNARMTGLVALMAAAKSTQKMFKEMDAEDVAHPVAFLALSGEDFGKLGSERIAREMLASTETSQLPGLAGKKIRAIIELGPLGFSESFVGERVPTIYVHGAHEGKMLERIEKIANTFEFEETAALGVPRILETAAPTFEALLANEYETAYLSEDPDAPIDELSGTTLDAGSFRAIDAERMETVVHVIARLVRALATNDKVDAPRLDVEGGKLAVKELTKCLTNENYGLERCELGKKFLYGEEASAPGLGESFVDPVALPSRYPDALQGLSRDMQSHEDKNALARFVWNYLADATSNTVSPKMCEGDGSCAENTVCVGRTPMSVGECHAATSKYMLALSTRLAFDRSTGLWIVNEPKDDVERAAPLWTESDWSPAIGATLVAPVKYNFFTSVDAFLLYGVICLMLVVAAQFCFDRDKKRGGAREREALLRGAQP